MAISLQFFFIADVAQAQQALAGIIAHSEHLGREIKALGRSMREAGFAFAAFAAAGSAAFKSLIDEGGALEQVLANIGSLASNEEEFNSQGEALKRLEKESSKPKRKSRTSWKSFTGKQDVMVEGYRYRQMS